MGVSPPLDRLWWSCPRSWHWVAESRSSLMGMQRTRVQAQCWEVEKDSGPSGVQPTQAATLSGASPVETPAEPQGFEPRD